MNASFYPDLKWLVSQGQWATYRKYIGDLVQGELTRFENEDASKLRDIQVRVKTFKDMVARLEQDLKDFEHDSKEKNK